MGKQTIVTCDSCGVDVWGKRYFTLSIQTINNGKQKRNPSIYLCPKCMRETKLAMLLMDIELADKAESEIEI